MPEQSGPSRTYVASQGMSIPEYAIVPPDGGWGWVIVVAAFYCNAVIDGIIFTFGTYLSDIVKDYNTEKARVALIASLMYGLHLSAGPLCAALTKTFGVRPVVVLGSGMASSALACAVLHPPLWLLTILYGVVAGIGMCFVYMSSLMITSMYFSRYRIPAVGAVVCGTGAGTVVFAQAGNLMLKTMSWHYSQLILSGFAMLMGLAGLCFRPLEPMRIATTPHISPQNMQSVISLTSLSSTWDDDIEDLNVVFLTKARTQSLVSAMNAADLALETYTAQMHGDKSVLRDGMARSISRHLSCFQPKVKVLLMHPHTRKHLISGEENKMRTWSSKTFFFSRKSRWQRVKESFTNMNWRIMRSVPFILYCVCGSFSATAIIMIFTFEKARALAEGFTADEATLFVTLLGTSNLCWRLGLGVISMFPSVNYHAVNVIGHCSAGVALMASTYIHSYTAYIILTIFFGYGFASYAVFRPVILLEIVGMDNLSDATGISLMFQGFLSVCGPPLGGWLISLLGSYDAISWIAGLLFFTSGVLCIFVTGKSPVVNPSQAVEDPAVNQRA